MNIVERQLANRMSESDFQGWVIDVAHLYGWRVMHSRPARRADGSWRTAIAGDVGFPDCVFAHPIRGLFLVAELKSQKGRVTLEQGVWLEALQVAGVRAEVWRPASRDYILKLLSGTKP